MQRGIASGGVVLLNCQCSGGVAELNGSGRHKAIVGAFYGGHEARWPSSLHRVLGEEEAHTVRAAHKADKIAEVKTQM